MDKQKLRAFVTDKKEQAERKARAALAWANTNREFLIVVSPVVIGGSVKLTQLMLRRHNLNLETQHRELYVYDRSLGHYWQLRRKLSNNEWVTIEMRRKGGESLASILSGMKLLK